MKYARNSLPLSLSRHLRLSPIKHLLELSHPMPHPTMHIRLRALDVIMEVVPEQRDMRDGLGRDGRRGEVAGEENESDVANLVAVA